MALAMIETLSHDGSRKVWSPLNYYFRFLNQLPSCSLSISMVPFYVQDSWESSLDSRNRKCLSSTFRSRTKSPVKSWPPLQSKKEMRDYIFDMFIQFPTRDNQYIYSTFPNFTRNRAIFNLWVVWSWLSVFYHLTRLLPSHNMSLYYEQGCIATMNSIHIEQETHMQHEDGLGKRERARFGPQRRSQQKNTNRICQDCPKTEKTIE